MILLEIRICFNVQLPTPDLLLLGTPGEFAIQLLPLLGPLQLRCDLIPMHEDIAMLCEVPINILERTVGRLRVEEVCGRDERRADHRPDDPELIAQVGNAWRCHLSDHVVHDPVGCHRY